MKTKQLSKLLACTAVVVGLSTPAMAITPQNTSPATDAQPRLQVAVQLPPSWWEGSFYYDDLADTFGSYVNSVFERMGYKGKVEYVDTFDKRPKDGYRLNIRLTEWRLNRVGNIDCVFSADLQTPNGERSLGLFTDTALSSITGTNRFWLARSFEDAAKGAIGQLYSKVAKDALLPGLSSGSA